MWKSLDRDQELETWQPEGSGVIGQISHSSG